MKQEVDIIIPTFNRVNILMKVLPSYLQQNSLNKLIIVDDGSTDDTQHYLLEACKKDTKIRYIRNRKNVGAPASRNVGISNATAPYIFFGEDDLELSEGHLSTLLSHLLKNKADIIAGRRLWMQPGESNSEALKRADKYKPKPVNYRLITTNCEVKTEADMQTPLLDASMLVRSSVFREVLYDAYYINGWREETDFQLSAGEKGYKLFYCPHTVGYHLAKIKDSGGSHSMSKTGYKLNMIRNNYYMTKKHWSYITAHFRIHSFSLFMIRFFIYTIDLENLLMPLIRIKKSVFG